MAASNIDTRVPPQPHQEITRHLAAAAHLRAGFADRVISTYVTAPQEALPPAPGVDAQVILTQALIARHRRGVRDALSMLAIGATGALLLAIDPSFAVFWLGFWLLWTGVDRTRRAVLRRKGNNTAGRLGLLATVGVWLVWVVLASYVSLPWGFFSFGYNEFLYLEALPISAWPVLILLGGLTALYLVLMADKLVILHFLATHGSEDPPQAPSPVVAGLARSLESFSTRKHRRLLFELAHRPASGHVLVHRDREAFVGHGDRVNTWTMALVLTEKQDGQTPATTMPRPSEIYEAVHANLSGLLGADLLAPGHRLRELSINSMLVASGRDLRRHSASPLGRDIFSDPTGRPAPAVPPETLRHLADHNEEWARYFLRCSVASWDSDLVVSTFLHVGCDDDTLYLEWNATCLFPLKPSYRMGGSFTTTPKHAARLVVREFKRVPSSMGRRWRSARSTVSAALDSTTTPTTYGHGSVRSIREIAADDHCSSEFQDLDVQRYIHILERRTLSAIHRYLSERGYATEELENRINTVINNTTLFKDAQFTGAQNFAAGGTASAENATTTTEEPPTEEVQ